MKQTLVTALCLTLVPFAVWAEGDATQGERAFRKCKACHEVGEGAKAKAGPVLNGIVGRDIASVEGFQYSDALITYGEGKVWTVEELDGFLAEPKKHVKGTKMAFAGVRKETERADIIAYLATFE